MKLLGQRDGPFGSPWRTSSWAYAMFLIAFVIGAVSGTLARHPLRYGAVFWAVTIGFFVYRRWSARSETRPCPRCGGGVRVGVLDCEECGFDFRTIGQTPPTSHSTQ